MIGPTTQVETWIAWRIGRPDLFAGVTTPDERRERVRSAIVNDCLSDAIVGRRPGHPCETWTDLFTRVYGQPLHGAQASTASRAPRRDATTAKTTTT